MSEPSVVLPTGWISIQLRRVVTCRDDLREPVNATERARRPGSIPYWGANSIQGYIDVARVKQPTVLLGEDGAPFFDRDKPVAFYVDEPIWPNNHIHVLFPRHGIDGRWLAYALNGVDYSTVITGSTRDKLTQNAMLRIQLYMPPLEKQAVLADFLDRETAQIDALISKQNALITVLLERKPAVLFDSVDGLEGERIRLRHLFRPSAEVNQPEEQVLSVYRDYGVIPKSSRSDNFNKTPENLDRYLFVRPGDLAVNRMKAWQGSLGISNHSGIVSADYEVLRPINDRLEPEFAHHLLRSPRLISEYRVRSTGIRPSQWRLYWDQMGDIAVAVPPTDVQQDAVHRIETQFASIEALIARTQQHIGLARERRAALITEAVTGQTEVTGRGAA